MDVPAAFADRTLAPLAGDDDLPRDYDPIRHYALIGDCHGAALVALDGSIDWCCFDRFDADPVFERLLDKDRGGFFEIRPTAGARAERRYVDDTNILETTFTTGQCSTGQGAVTVTDFMPVGRKPGTGAADYVSLNLPGWIVRIVACLTGRMRLRACYRPSGSGFAKSRPPIVIGKGKVAAAGCPSLYSCLDFEKRGDLAVGFIDLKAGERCSFILAPAAWGGGPVDRVADQLHRVTSAFWTEWSGFTAYDGRYRNAVIRSALLLKALTYAPTGAIVAAPTTSLPEEIGGVRNWDYRFCWLRDAAFVLYALIKLGHAGEARRFFEFLMTVAEETLPRVPPLYAIAGETDMTERVLDHLDGYQGSRPVRAGNDAVEQRQADVYGQLLDLTDLYVRLGGAVDDRTRTVLCTLADDVAEHWREPDAGLWEPRLPERRHVHSAMMCWVAMDRAIRLFGPREAWCRARDAILADLRDNAVDPAGGWLTQVFGDPAVDAALLLAPMLDLPVGDEIVARTVDRVRERLGDGPLVWRYRNDDGLPGGEGAFLVCSFWLVDALLALDRGDEARAVFEDMLGRANDVGLYSEEMAGDGRFLGNFPQAFTHLGLIHSALALDLYERGGAAAVRGSYADRACRDGERLDRYRTMWSDFEAVKGGRPSSRASILDEADFPADTAAGVRAMLHSGAEPSAACFRDLSGRDLSGKDSS